MKRGADRHQKYMYMNKDENNCDNMELAHAYVPWQYYTKAFSPQEALIKGTLFPELYGVYAIPR